MIELIAKNKLLEYLNQTPEAKIPLLIWLKEGHLNRHFDFVPEGPLQESAQLGASKFYIDYWLNPFLKTAYVKWLGTFEQRQTLMRQEMERLRTEQPDLKSETLTTTVVLTPPPPLDTDSTSFDQAPDLNLPLFTENEEPQRTGETFSNETDYEKAVDRAIELFASPPGTSSFDELAELVPLIRSYEAQYVKFPQLDLSAAVKSRMKDFQITQEELSPYIASEEEIDLFLSGKETLATPKLRALLRMLGLGFTV